MVGSGWARHAAATVATTAAVVYGFQAGCFYPDYTFNEPEPSGAGGTTASSGASSAGGAPSTSSAASTGVGGAASSTASGSASATSGVTASSSAASSSTGGVVVAPANVIDDMEAGSGSILQQGGRVGTWYT